MNHDDAARRETLRGAVEVLHDLCSMRVDDEAVDVIGRAAELGRLSCAAAELGGGNPDWPAVGDQITGNAALVLARDALWLAVADLDEDPKLAKLAAQISKHVARRLFPYGAP